MSLLRLFNKTSGEQTDRTPAPVKTGNGSLVDSAEAMLLEVTTVPDDIDAVKLPIAQLYAMEAGVASLLPSLRTISTSATLPDSGLYRCVFPQGVKGYLASAKDGSNLGTILNEKGIVAQARWEKVGPQKFNVTGIAPINPATMMMAAALIAIDKKLDDVLETEKEILSFLEEDKESKIEGDLKTLTSILKEYKFNWDNSTYTATHHQLAADIKRDAEANMLFYQKQITHAIKENPALLLQKDVDSALTDFLKKFRYYRLCVYLHGFASFLEVMLQGKYEAGYIEQIRQDITDRAAKYSESFDTCFRHLEKMTASTVEHHLLKDLGAAEKAVGRAFGSIPIVRDSQAGERLIQSGNSHKQNGEDFGRTALRQMEAIRDSGNRIFIEHLDHVNRLFNQTGEILIGKDCVYLVKGAAE